MAEWSIAAVLKTVVPRGTRGSNPSLSAQKGSPKAAFLLVKGRFSYIETVRRGARVVEEARLESVYTPKGYHEFESRSLRNLFQFFNVFYFSGCVVIRLFLSVITAGISL